MKSLITALIFTLLCTSAGVHLSAQSDAAEMTNYAMIEHMHVAPGMHDDYLQLESAWKKIHAANVAAGKYNTWVLARVAFPNGAQASHNYVTRLMFRGEEQLANFMAGSIYPDDLESLLSAEELALVERTSEIRTYVKSELYSSVAYLESEDATFGPGTVTVFNYFGNPNGRNMDATAHLRVERDHWMPVHQARIEAGDMTAWVLLNKILPYGDSEPYHSATVDIYQDMAEFLSASSPAPTIMAMLDEDEIETMFTETEAAATLSQAEVRIELDRVSRE